MITKFTCPNCQKMYKILLSRRERGEVKQILTIEDLREAHPEVHDQGEGEE